MVVVDDHPVVRAGLCAIISSQKDMVVFGEHSTAIDALRSFEKARPDVVLMDLRLPGLSGLEAIRTLNIVHGFTQVLVLTTYEGDEDIHQALQAGAAAYIIKGMSSDRLLQGIRRVYAGKTYMPPEVSQAVMDRSAGKLSPREQEVLTLIGQGKSNRAIAADLGISEGTVKCHVGVILSHFGVTDRTQAVLQALRRGYVRL
ncbi:response regulator transcription factor [Granulicella pectinivorans]|uniref:response regulator transcription factor n=1 Tax=Granulicella pectinivorans TaxID=474950 RepID=UPI0031846305